MFSHHPPPTLRRLSVVVGFVCLDGLALALESPGPQSLWHPAAALTLVAFFWWGRYAAVPLLLGAAGAALLAPAQGPGIVLETVIGACIYGVAAGVLGRSFRMDLSLRTVRDVTGLVLSGVLASLAVSALTVKLAPWSSSALEVSPGALVRFWLQDQVGILTLAPALLVYGPHLSERPFRVRPGRHGPGGVLERLGQTLAIGVSLWVNLCVPVTASLDLYYWCFLPLIWIALREGLPGAVVGSLAINTGAAAAVTAFPLPSVDATELQVFMTALPIMGLFLGAVVTSRGRVEEELRSATRAAEAANRAKTAFLANVGHELRTPLNSVLGYTELVLDGIDGEVNPEQRRSLRKVQHQAELLRDLIDRVLDLVSLDAGELSAGSAAFRLGEVLASLERDFSPEAERRGLTFAVEAGAGVPEHLRGDPQRLRQLLALLLENAVKFTECGTVSLAVDEEARSPSAVRLRFTVRDTGIGIPEEKLEEIFGVFAQADASLTRRHGGAGIGLAVAVRLARLLGGRLWADRGAACGATFTFEAPFDLDG